MIDLTVVLIVIWAVVMGMRRGLVVQLCHMAGLYAAIIVASRYASAVGGIFLHDDSSAAAVGFSLIVAVVMLAVWIIAPMIRSIVVWRPVRHVDAVTGAAVSVAAVLMALGALFSVFDKANVDTESISAETLRENPDAVRRYIETGEPVRELFRHKYVDFSTLDKSLTFGALVRLGDALCPQLSEIDRAVRSAADEYMQRTIDGCVPLQNRSDDAE
ncbi:MAG: CvpA family protein [Alistipes sp.]|nr:CvpA family protein [Alistipes sp.]MDE6862141.1 CvpA family protein [Alistipes sp.]